MPEYHTDGLVIPAPIVASMDAYVERGRATGAFLRAVFANDLVGACLLADANNRALIPAYARWVFHYCPAIARGSYDAATAPAREAYLAAIAPAWARAYINDTGEKP